MEPHHSFFFVFVLSLIFGYLIIFQLKINYSFSIFGAKPRIRLGELLIKQKGYYNRDIQLQSIPFGTFVDGRTEKRSHLTSCNAYPEPEVVLGRPTSNCVTFKVWSNLTGTFFLQYGTDISLGLFSYNSELNPQDTVTYTLENLQENTRYFYQLQYNYSDSYCSSNIHSFVTSRASSEIYSFAILSDIHYQSTGYDQGILELCLSSIENAEPDFLIDLGHAFFGYQRYTASTIRVPYESMFHEYSEICHSIPLFLLNGFQDGENGWEIISPPENSMPVITAETRKNYYANPEPNFFYTGNEDQQYGFGYQGNYYAWTWGASLFVAIDPNWYTNTFPKYGSDCGMGWCWTLGLLQYSWLGNTLANTDVVFKFVFTHHLLGGAFGDQVIESCEKGPNSEYDGFGGEQFIQYFEWGGNDENGEYKFPLYRPDWPNVPLHSLFVNSGVNIVFKGQDQFFSQFTSNDGLLYLTVPRPFTPNLADPEEYAKKLICHGYDPADPTVQIDGGFFQVQVTATTATVNYILSSGETKESITIQK